MPTGSLTTIGSWSFEIQITDSSSSPVTVTSALVNVSVNAALSAPIISVTPTALDLGQSSTLATTTSFSGGTAPYGSQWLAKAPGGAIYGRLGSSFPFNRGDKHYLSTCGLFTTGHLSLVSK